MNKIIWLLLLFILGYILSNAQEYPLQHYGTKEGLPHITVYRIFQDKKGFLWFCTDFGLSKFDGKTFKNYSTKDGLSHNIIISVTEDDSARMLVSSYKQGIVILSDTSIKKLKVAKGDLPKNIAYTLPDKDKIWIISFIKGGRLYLLKQDEVRNIPAKTGKQEDVDFFKLYRFGSEIMFATNDGIYTAINDSAVIPFLLKGENISDIKEDKNGGYWIGIKSKVVHYFNNKFIESYDLPKEVEISDLLVDRNHNLWIAGIPSAIFLIKDKVLTDIRKQMKIPKVFINNLCEDKEGNIWIATHGKGVYRLNSLEAINYTIEDKTINAYCTSITPVNEKKLLLSSYGKLSILEDGQLKTINSSLPSSEYIYFSKNINNKFYIGTPHNLISKEMVPPYREIRINKKLFGAISICSDTTGQIILGTYDNLFKIKNNEIVPFDSTGFLKGKRCNHILSANGALWILTEEGTIKLENGHYNFEDVPELNHPFISGNVLKDSHNRLWFATQNGLVCRDKGKYKVYTTADGLTDNLCKFLYEDDEGNLWLSTANNNINVIDLKTLRITEFIIDIDVPEILSFYRKNNTLYLGTIEGLSVIDITQAFTKEVTPLLYITSVKTRNATYTSPRELELAHNDNKLTIEFTGINYRHPENVEFRYMIRNLDNTWHVTKNNSIELSSLPGGDYDFILSSRLKNSKWGPEVTLPIKIAIPFWKTTWFTFLSMLVSLVLIYFITRKIILRSEAKKNEQLLILNKITYLKQQALSALINPHFIFNCMNSIQHYMNKNDREAANNYLSDFATLVRMTMEDAQEAFINLEEEIKRLDLYLALEKLRFGDKLEYKIAVNGDLDIHSIRIPNMILQPYVENAILHGILPKKEKGKINVYFSMVTDTELIIIIEDNGVGLNYDKKHNSVSKHNSFGMKLTEERLDLLNKFSGQHYSVNVMEVYNPDGAVRGTAVEITLPCYPDEKNISLLEDRINE